MWAYRTVEKEPTLRRLFARVNRSVFGPPTVFPLAVVLTMLTSVMVSKDRLGRYVPAAPRQFPSAIPGALHPSQVGRSIESMRDPIPDQLWGELEQERVLGADAPTPWVLGELSTRPGVTNLQKVSFVIFRGLQVLRVSL